MSQNQGLVPLNVLIKPEQKRFVEETARAKEVSVSSIIRQIIKATMLTKQSAPQRGTK